MTNIIISCGDPAGVGPEIIARSVFRYNPPDVLYTIYGALLPFAILADEYRWGARFMDAVETGAIKFVEIYSPDKLARGKIDVKCGEIAAKAIFAAIDSAKNGNADAIVTAPISKQALQIAGYNYPGHTEMFAEAFSTDVTMMLFAGGFRVSLATTHIPIERVAGEIEADMLYSHIERTHRALTDWFGIGKPCIGVLALNPHGGEGGRIGDEECEIASAIETARAQNIDAIGPIVPDVAFLPSMRRKMSAYIAMYHDQGLIALKTVGFRRGVNITIGLPLPRTSPDHGTAFDIAGKGIASPSSFINAMRAAVKITRRIKLSKK